MKFGLNLTSKMKLLVFGGSGFVGRYILKELGGIGTSSSGIEGFTKLDISDRLETINLVKEIKPEVVVNCSAIADVDACERDKETAMKINGYSVANVVEAAKSTGSLLVHISTDYVFDGEKGDYSEEDPTNPINAYGLSKLKGEEEALKYGKTAVIRISTPFGINYGAKKKSFAEFIINNLKEGKEINVVTDQYTTSTYLGDLVKAIKELYNKKESGIFHLGIRERLSRYDFALEIADSLNRDKSLIKPSKLDDFKRIAKRPKDTSLNSGKISKIIDITPLKEALKELSSTD